MGYYTRYTLTIEPETDEVVEYLEKNENSYQYGAWTQNMDDCTWYENETDYESI